MKKTLWFWLFAAILGGLVAAVALNTDRGGDRLQQDIREQLIQEHPGLAPSP